MLVYRMCLSANLANLSKGHADWILAVWTNTANRMLKHLTLIEQNRPIGNGIDGIDGF